LRIAPETPQAAYQNVLRESPEAVKPCPKEYAKDKKRKIPPVKEQTGLIHL